MSADRAIRVKRGPDLARKATGKPSAVQYEGLSNRWLLVVGRVRRVPGFRRCGGLFCLRVDGEPQSSCVQPVGSEALEVG